MAGRGSLDDLDRPRRLTRPWGADRPGHGTGRKPVLIYWKLALGFPAKGGSGSPGPTYVAPSCLPYKKSPVWMTWPAKKCGRGENFFDSTTGARLRCRSAPLHTAMPALCTQRYPHPAHSDGGISAQVTHRPVHSAAGRPRARGQDCPALVVELRPCDSQAPSPFPEFPGPAHPPEREPVHESSQRWSPQGPEAMFAYVGLVVAGTPLVLGLVALLRGRREDIPAILQALRRKDRNLRRHRSARGADWGASRAIASVRGVGRVGGTSRVARASGIAVCDGSTDQAGAE
jgi:hypothetical protein